MSAHYLSQGGTMRVLRLVLFALFALGFAPWSLIGPQPAGAQGSARARQQQAMQQQQPQPSFAKLDFNSTDYLRIKLGKMKPQYYVGEPVVVPLTISNHTRFVVTVTTNFAPRSHLNVNIRPSDRPSRRYFGPYPPGSFPTLDLELLPLGQQTENVLLWADNIQETGLIFPYPGTYVVEMALRVSVQGGQINNELTVAPFQVTIVDTPPNLVPMIELMKNHKLFDQFHRKVLAETEVDTARKLVKDFPVNAVTPYAYLAIGSHLTYLHESNPSKALADEILIAFQVAAKSYSAYRFPTYLTLLNFMDKLEMTHPAYLTFVELLREMPKEWQGRIGNNELAQKYLINSKELPPLRSWTLLQ